MDLNSKSLTTLGFWIFRSAQPASLQQRQQPAWPQPLPGSGQLQGLQHLPLPHILVLKRIVSELLANTVSSVSFSFHCDSLKSPPRGRLRGCKEEQVISPGSSHNCGKRGLGRTEDVETASPGVFSSVRIYYLIFITPIPKIQK